MSDKNHLYQDKSGVIHSCESGKMHPGVVLVWTDCGEDVPANQSFKSHEKPTCPDCLSAEQTNDL